MFPEDPDPRVFPIKGGRKNRDAAPGEPIPPGEPAAFDSTAHAILKKARITDKQFNTYVKQLTYYYLTHASAEWLKSAIDGIKRGKARDMNSFEKIAGMVKGDGFVINLLQNNLSLNASGGNSRDFDALLREIDRAERQDRSVSVEEPRAALESAPEVIDVDVVE